MIKIISSTERKDARDRKSPPLEPCPFCGARNYMTPHAVYPNGSAQMDFAVRCASCDAIGPSAASAFICIKLWNERKRPRKAYRGNPIGAPHPVKIIP